MIPKYCYFKAESETRGCCFVIDRHPKIMEHNKLRKSMTFSSINFKSYQLKELVRFYVKVSI